METTADINNTVISVIASNWAIYNLIITTTLITIALAKILCYQTTAEYTTDIVKG